MITPLLQFRPQVTEVVDFTVEHSDHRGVVTDHGLYPGGGNTNDGQPSVSKIDVGRTMEPDAEASEPRCATDLSVYSSRAVGKLTEKLAIPPISIELRCHGPGLPRLRNFRQKTESLASTAPPREALGTLKRKSRQFCPQFGRIDQCTKGTDNVLCVFGVEIHA